MKLKHSLNKKLEWEIKVKRNLEDKYEEPESPNNPTGELKISNIGNEEQNATIKEHGNQVCRAYAREPLLESRGIGKLV